jgi:hypothetical protein
LAEEFCNGPTVALPVYSGVVTECAMSFGVNKRANGFELRSEQTAMASYEALKRMFL